nr:7TM diverse intracellular signaling domain-containing protein [uncultured Pseudodesulfovibrio sp.]
MSVLTSLPPKRLQLFLLVCVSIFICFIVGCRGSENAVPVAERGVLDLSGWNPALDNPIALDGQWEFYWDRLLTPEDFVDGGNVRFKSGYLTFPGYWTNHDLEGHPLHGAGQATFRLRVLMPLGNHDLTVRFVSVRAAYQVWANGEPVASSGVVGRSDETETPDRSIFLSRIASDGTPVELVMQISNHFFPGGGVQNPIMLAGPGPLEKVHEAARGWGLLFAGCMLIMAVYHFILYILRKKDVSTLYFGFYCIVLTVLVAASDSSDWLIRAYLPNLQFVSVSKTALVCYAISTSILYRFYRSLYPKEFGRLLLYIVDIRGLLFIAIVLSQPGVVYQSALQLFALTAIFFTACFIVLLFICFRRGYSGSLILLCGIVLLGMSSTHDVYFLIFNTHVVSLLPLGLFALVMSQAGTLALRFSKSFADVESLSEKLEIKNMNLEKEIAERSRLEREIVNISEEERRRISLDLHDGLCQQLTGARLRCAALSWVSPVPNGKDEELRQLSLLLDELVDQAYDLSCGIWPLEHGTGNTGPSLEDMVRRYSRLSGIPMKFSDKRACETCRNMQVTQLYRIAQEAIANAVKHAKPESVVIRFDCVSNGLATLTVRDDGVGRSAAAHSKGGLGMSIMAHRAMMIGGELEIVDVDESEGGGTKVICSIACNSGTQKKCKEGEA